MRKIGKWKLEIGEWNKETLLLLERKGKISLQFLISIFQFLSFLCPSPTFEKILQQLHRRLGENFRYNRWAMIKFPAGQDLKYRSAGPRLRIVSSKDHHWNSRLNNGPRAHRAWLERYV
jgi:hypothetical protein